MRKATGNVNNGNKKVFEHLIEATTNMMYGVNSRKAYKICEAVRPIDRISKCYSAISMQLREINFVRKNILDDIFIYFDNLEVLKDNIV